MPNEINEQKAKRAIDFIEKLCTHTKGKWAGKPFILFDWQRELIRELFGRCTPEGLRQYRTFYGEIPKKNGKSELAAAVALICLCADDERGGEIYGAASDRGQASIVFHVAAQMVRNKPTLSKRLRVLDSQKRIIDYKTGSFYQVLSSEAFTKHGINPSAIIFDELHAQPNRELWDVLTEGTDYAREQQLVFAITTAGVYNPQSICWEVREHARQVKEGIIDDPRTLPLMFTATKEDDCASPDLWARVNPSIGQIFSLDKIAQDYNEVKDNPARLNNFLRFRLNIWVNQLTRWMPMDKWNACKTKFDIKDLLKKPCYGALDLSATQDLTAFVLLFPPSGKHDKWISIPQFFCPAESIVERSRRDRVPYIAWRDKGYITATPGNVVDYSFIRQAVKDAAAKYKIIEVAYDPWRALPLVMDLKDKDGIEMVEMPQRYKELSPGMNELLKMVLTKEFAHDGNPILTWNADNIVLREGPDGSIRPDKGKAREKIDGIVALIMAMGRAVAHSETTSVYDERGVRSI